MTELDLRTALRTRLTAALSARDRAAAAALRSVIADLDNAEAITVTESDGPAPVGSEYVAGTVVGLGAAEARRRELSAAEQRIVVEQGIAARATAAADYDEHGLSAPAARLRREADIIRDALDAT